MVGARRCMQALGVAGLGCEDALVHLLNFVVMFINFMISRHPFHFKNGIFVAIYLLTYVLFTIVYWAAGESTSLSKVPRNDQRSLHCS